MVNLKVLLYLENQPTVSCIQIVTQLKKTLQQIGNFFYDQQKIDFNEFVFANKPVQTPTIKSQRISNKQSFKNKSFGLGIKQNQEQVKIFTNQEVIQNILVHLKKQKQTHYLILMYSKKDLDLILRKEQNLNYQKAKNKSYQKHPAQQQDIQRQNDCQIC